MDMRIRTLGTRINTGGLNTESMSRGKKKVDMKLKKVDTGCSKTYLHPESSHNHAKVAQLPNPPPTATATRIKRGKPSKTGKPSKGESLHHHESDLR